MLIDGQVQDLGNRQTELYQTYRARLRRLSSTVATMDYEGSQDRLPLLRVAACEIDVRTAKVLRWRKKGETDETASP